MLYASLRAIEEVLDLSKSLCSKRSELIELKECLPVPFRRSYSRKGIAKAKFAPDENPLRMI
jgi:hypothetical protein